jgi:hypothetical protein
MATLLNDVTHWHNRAEEARIVAEGLTDSVAKRMMLGVAESYDKLVRHAEARIAADTHKSGD